MLNFPPCPVDGMDRLGGLSGTPRHRILTGRIRARTRDWQMHIWPAPRGRESASVKECDGRLGTPDNPPGDLFSSSWRPPPALRVRARIRYGMRAMRTSFFAGDPAAGIPAKKSKSALSACAPLFKGGLTPGGRSRAAQPPSRPQTHLRIPRLRRLAARACHAPAPAADARSDFGVAFPRATGRDRRPRQQLRCTLRKRPHFCHRNLRDSVLQPTAYSLLLSTNCLQPSLTPQTSGHSFWSTSTGSPAS